MALTWYVLIAAGNRPGWHGQRGDPARRHGDLRPGRGEYGSAPGVTIHQGHGDRTGPSGAPFTAIGAGNLRANVQGQDDAGHAALAN